MNRRKLTTILTAVALFITSTVSAAPLDKVQFIKIAPQDSRAVIKGANGKLQVIKQGDMISETVTVREIAPGRIILEEKTDKGPETLIVRIENGRQRIERIRKQADVRPAPIAPAPSQKQ